MGFPLDLVQSEDGHTTEFVCVICSGLVEYPVITSCSHVYCKSCLFQWLPRRPSCPKCNAHLGLKPDGRSPGVALLREANPLGWRVLARIRVRCPLSEATGCGWTGEFSEVQAHLTNSGDHTGREPVPRAEAQNLPSANGAGAADGLTAEDNGAGGGEPMVEVDPTVTAKALKEEADNKFSAKEYADATRLYTKAITVAPAMPQLYANRAAAYLMMGQLSQLRRCVSDCDQALAIDPAFARVYVRKARALVALGDFSRADATLAAAAAACPSHRDVAAERVQVQQLRAVLDEGIARCSAGDFAEGRALLGTLLASTNAPGVMLAVARAELGLGFSDRALRLTLRLLRQDRSHVAGYVVRGRAFLLDGDFDGARELLREALRLDPDDAEAKVYLKATRRIGDATKGARQAAFNRRFSEAVDLFGEALAALAEAHAHSMTTARGGASSAEAENRLDLPEHASLVATVFAQRASAQLRLGQLPEALGDTDRALRAQPDSREAWLARADVLHAMERHDQCVREVAPLLETWGAQDAQVRHVYDRAVFEHRKAKRPDYYGVLEVPRVASEMEVKRAYKFAAMKHHPDRHSRKSAAEQAAAAETFKQVGEALEVLTDAFKRGLYDEGYDLEAINERAEAAKCASQNPHHGYHHGYHGHHHHHHH